MASRVFSLCHLVTICCSVLVSLVAVGSRREGAETMTGSRQWPMLGLLPWLLMVVIRSWSSQPVDAISLPDEGK